jgi:hypothetical protein
VPWFRISKQVFDFELFSADSSCFIPEYLSRMDSAIRQSHPGDSLALAPPAAPVRLSETIDFANSRPGGEGLNVGNIANNIEARRLKVSSSPDIVNGGSRLQT